MIIHLEVTNAVISPIMAILNTGKRKNLNAAYIINLISSNE